MKIIGDRKINKYVCSNTRWGSRERVILEIKISAERLTEARETKRGSIKHI